MKEDEFKAFLKKHSIEIVRDGTAYGFNIYLVVPYESLNTFYHYTINYNIENTFQTKLLGESIVIEITDLLTYYKIDDNTL